MLKLEPKTRIDLFKIINFITYYQASENRQAIKILHKYTDLSIRIDNAKYLYKYEQIAITDSSPKIDQLNYEKRNEFNSFYDNVCELHQKNLKLIASFLVCIQLYGLQIAIDGEINRLYNELINEILLFRDSSNF